MKRHSTTIIVAIAAATITFLVTNALEPRQAVAPTISESTSGKSGIGTAVVIPMNIISIEEHASTTPGISIEYPQFPSLSDDFNSAVASATMSRLNQFNSDVKDNVEARGRFANATPSATIPMSAYTFFAAWQPAQVTSRFVSFVEHYDTYSGGANGDQDVQTFNYDIARKKMVALTDLFPGVPDYLSKISVLAKNQLAETLAQNSNGNVPTDMLEAGTQPTLDNFANFTFTATSITFYFPKYAVAPGSFGAQEVTFPLSSVR